MLEKVKLAIFDMDGLMLNTEIEYYKAQLEECRKHGLKVDPSKLIEAIGSSEFDLDGFFLGQTGDRKEQLANMLNRAMQEAIARMCREGAPLKPGADELTEYFMQMGIPMVIATSTPRIPAHNLMSSTGLMNRFAAMVTSDEVLHSKPAPDLFLQACIIGKVKPEDAIVFEDSENGALAAQRAGIPYVLVPDLAVLDPKEEENALLVAASLLDVLNAITERKEEK